VEYRGEGERKGGCEMSEHDILKKFLIVAPSQKFPWKASIAMMFD